MQATDFQPLAKGFTHANLNNQPAYLNGDGLQTRDFTFVDNVVQANIKAMFTENKDALNQVYNIGLGGRFTLLDLYSTIAELTGSTQPPLFREPRAGDIRDSQANIDKARIFLGYEPEIGFREGLSITVEWFKHRSNYKIVPKSLITS